MQFLNLHKNKPVSAVLSVLIIIGFRLGNFFYPTVISDSAGPLYEILQVTAWNSFLQTLAGICLVLISLFIFDYILNRYNLIGSLSGLPLFFYAVMASLHPSMGSISPGLTALPFVTLALWALLINFGEKKGQFSAFWAGFAFSLAVLFYWPLLVLIPFAITALSLMKPATGKEFISLILGLALPFGWVFVLFFLTDHQTAPLPIPGYADLVSFFSEFPRSWGIWLTVAVCFGLLNVGLFNVVQSFNANKIIVRRFLAILITLPAFLLAGFGLSTYPSSDIFWLLVFPFSVLMSRLFPEIKNPGLQKLLLGILFITILLARFDFYFGGSFTLKLVN